MFRAALLALLFALSARAGADEALIAVAANFARTAEALADAYEAESGYMITISSGSTGQLYARIVQGAPYDAFLSADAERPALLVETGQAEAWSRFTYAVGRLVLWSADPDRIGPDGAVALSGDFRFLAIANPRTAPYGAAAMETLEALGLTDAVQDRLVTGGDVGATYAFIASGNAELGFIALSQLPDGQGSAWIVPEHLHAPLAQDVVLLARGADNPAAVGFLAFLRSDEARAVIEAAGYGAGARE
ncbi:molybdate ABC transporter substrate-binding protein [Hyphobacterium sp. SN044]|uniref:molybdate ABC transporter substrate-binding protein n=1 Tax=Hyphobacterium sp. SN044 TaxID=2912575 RepID=UPI001F02B65F|nr:molybdate ABC transporter substrate-binding protein [Hyphobacterium sp. SN044]MCF8880658.1 molybdate ABC transporter substrate-binding protein [Hyphobacterium sp. SN044]